MTMKLSLTYRFLRAIGLNYSVEEYGQISLFEVIGRFFKNPYHLLLQKMMDSVILEPLNPRLLRSVFVRALGAKVGKHVFFGDHVRIDNNHADLITIEDYAHITGGCRLLCHQRDLSGYCKGDNAAKLPYKLGKIHIGKGVMIGMETLIMPGVTIGDGAIVGAYSLVTKDIPAWTIATGRPAKVVKEISDKQIKKDNE
jgi:acetyltransferase-like isoleucine patch superfamily enzyme